jgi:transcription elongation factor Elf1
MSADRPFQCPQCRRHFRSYPSLKRHMETDHYTPRKCGICGKVLRENEYHRC